MNEQPPPVPAASPAPATTPQSCGFATASLVLGILGLICILPVVGSICAIIFGIVALSQINKSKGQLAGHGKAMAGLIMGCVSLIMIPIMAIILAMLLPAIATAREQARRVACASNEKQLALACVIYAQDYDGLLPQSFDQLSKYGVTSDKLLKCPSDPDAAGSSYELMLAGRKLNEIKEPSTTPLVTESPGNHHGRGSNVAYADGHVQWVAEQGSSSSRY